MSKVFTFSDRKLKIMNFLSFIDEAMTDEAMETVLDLLNITPDDIIDLTAIMRDMKNGVASYTYDGSYYTFSSNLAKTRIIRVLTSINVSIDMAIALKDIRLRDTDEAVIHCAAVYRMIDQFQRLLTVATYIVRYSTVA